jgi:hypothetical protein
VFIGWVDNLVDNTVNSPLMIEIHKNKIIEKCQTLKSVPAFSQSKKESYGKINALRLGYTYTTADLQNEGSVYSFSKGNRTYVISVEGAVDDRYENEKGFFCIRESFSCGNVGK